MSSENQTSNQCPENKENPLISFLAEHGLLNDIWLNKDELDALIVFAPIWHSPDKIAKCVGVSGERYSLFIKEMHDPLSPIRQIVDFVRLKESAEIKANAILRAKESAAGERAFKLIEDEEKIKSVRANLLPDLDGPVPDLLRGDARKELAYFSDLQNFFENGNADQPIPDYLLPYWNKLNITIDLLNSFKYRAKGRKYIMKVLRKKFDCSEQYAYKIINDAAYFFNINEDKNILFRRLYEDLEKIKVIAWEKNDDKTFVDAVKQQKDIVIAMRDSSDIPQELYEGRVIITSHNPEDFGIAPVDREALAAKIKKYKISKLEKQKLLNEINIKANYTEEDLSE